MRLRRWGLAAAAGAIAVVGLSALPGLGASAPPGGAALTRLYDPATATTTFTVDVARGSGTALSVVTCPGASVLSVAGPARGEVVESLAGTTITFPSDVEGTYRVVLSGDDPQIGVGRGPSGCAGTTLLIDPAVIERTSAEVGPSTRIATNP